MGKEGAVVKELGIRLEFAGDIVFSSSNLINRYLSNLPKDLLPGSEENLSLRVLSSTVKSLRHLQYRQGDYLLMLVDSTG